VTAKVLGSRKGSNAAQGGITLGHRALSARRASGTWDLKSQVKRAELNDQSKKGGGKGRDRKGRSKLVKSTPGRDWLLLSPSPKLGDIVGELKEGGGGVVSRSTEENRDKAHGKRREKRGGKQERGIISLHRGGASLTSERNEAAPSRLTIHSPEQTRMGELSGPGGGMQRRGIGGNRGTSQTKGIPVQWSGSRRDEKIFLFEIGDNRERGGRDRNATGNSAEGEVP